MTDRELLEMAAKAAGMPLGYSYLDEGPCGSGIYWTESGALEPFAFWNPLADGGNALQLAVKLNLFVDTLPPATRVGRFTHPVFLDIEVLEEIHGTDPYAATCRAIVRAAAEIGKKMP